MKADYRKRKEKKAPEAWDPSNISVQVEDEPGKETGKEQQD